MKVSYVVLQYNLYEKTFECINQIYDFLNTVDNDFKVGYKEQEIAKNNYISFRVPGATRGGIQVINNVIVNIVFDEEMCFGKIGCYKRGVERYIKDKFLGTKFDLPIVDIHK